MLALLGAAAPATPASAARSLSWSAGRVSGSPILIAVACPASNLCVAFGQKVLVSKDPSVGARSWKPVPGLHIPPNLLTMESINIYDVACPSTHLCLTGTGGQLVYTTNPLGGASAWRKLTLDTAPSDEIAAISVPIGAFLRGADPGAADLGRFQRHRQGVLLHQSGGRPQHMEAGRDT